MWGGSVKTSIKKVKKDKKLSSYEVSKIVYLSSNKFFLQNSRSMGKWIDTRYTKNVEILTDEEVKERLKPYNGPYSFDWKEKKDKNKNYFNKFKGGR